MTIVCFHYCHPPKRRTSCSQQLVHVTGPSYCDSYGTASPKSCWLMGVRVCGVGSRREGGGPEEERARGKETSDAGSFRPVGNAVAVGDVGGRPTTSPPRPEIKCRYHFSNPRH